VKEIIIMKSHTKALNRVLGVVLALLVVCPTFAADKVAQKEQRPDVPNATISGIGGTSRSAPAVSEVVVTKIDIAGNKATILLAPSQVIQNARSTTAGGANEIPEIVVEIKSGPKWTFYGSHALYQDVAIPSGAQGTSSLVKLTIEFKTMKGLHAGWDLKAAKKV
jgi:hypothetical protein